MSVGIVTTLSTILAVIHGADYHISLAKEELENSDKFEMILGSTARMQKWRFTWWETDQSAGN